MTDPFADINAQDVVVRESPKSKRAKYQNPTSAAPVSRLDAQRATGNNRGMHGNYKQANFKLKPEVLDEIDLWAERLGVNKSQLKRYLAWRGLQALEEGERPEYAEVAKKDLLDY